MFSRTVEVQSVIDGLREAGFGAIAAEDCGPMIAEAILDNRFWLMPNAECYFDVFDRELAELKAGE